MPRARAARINRVILDSEDIPDEVEILAVQQTGGSRLEACEGPSPSGWQMRVVMTSDNRATEIVVTQRERNGRGRFFDWQVRPTLCWLMPIRDRGGSLDRAATSRSWR